MSLPEFVLASASPRRKELLSLIFSAFRIVPSDFDESAVPDNLSPSKHVLHSATMKARDVTRKCPDALVIGADTVVVVGESILGKPADADQAGQMLRLLSGRTHQVYTGVALVQGNRERGGYECTDVVFSKLTDEVISRYVASGEPLDKAGAYAIQGRGSVLISSISGCYPNVVGLPLHKLGTLLKEFGIELLIEE